MLTSMLSPRPDNSPEARYASGRRHHTGERPMSTVNANIAAPRLLLVAGGAVQQIAEVLGKFGLRAR